MRHNDVLVIHKKPKNMLLYACVYFLIAAVSCEPSVEVQNQLPRLLVTPNQLGSGALLRLQQNPYFQTRAALYNPNQPGPGFRQDIQYFPSNVAQNPTDSNVRTLNENILLTNSRIQQTPSGQPEVLLYNPAQAGHPGGQGRATIEFPTLPRGISQESDGRDSTDGNNKNANKQITGRPLNPTTFLKLQQTPSGQPGILLHNPAQIGHPGAQGRATVEFPTLPRGVNQKSDGNDLTDRKKENINRQITGQQGGIAPIALNPGTYLKLQQTPSAQPGVLISYPSQTGQTPNDGGRRNDGAETSSRRHDEESDIDNNNHKLQPAVSQLPFGSLIRFQQNRSQEPGVFLYNPPQQATSSKKDSDADEEGEIETATKTEVNPKKAAGEVGGKNLTNQKLTSPNGDNGKYYIYHPTGLLQKVTYSTKDDKAKMSFLASLRYQNVEPIREPIYTYDPKTFVFRRV